MKIAVLVKEVPDSWEPRVIDLETGLVAREGVDAVADEIGERALETALRMRETKPPDLEIEIVAVTMGPERAAGTVRRLLGLGADQAVHIVDDALVGADMRTTSRALAAALRRLAPDLVVTGARSGDGSGAVIPAMLAERLGYAQATMLDEVVLERHAAAGVRRAAGATVAVRAMLPAVVSVTEQVPEARLPNMRALMAAKRKPVERWSLADLGIDAESVTTEVGIMTDVRRPDPRAAGTVIVDDGDAAGAIAAFLRERGLLGSEP